MFHQPVAKTVKSSSISYGDGGAIEDYSGRYEVPEELTGSDYMIMNSVEDKGDEVLHMDIENSLPNEEMTSS